MLVGIILDEVSNQALQGVHVNLLIRTEVEAHAVHGLIVLMFGIGVHKCGIHIDHTVQIERIEAEKVLKIHAFLGQLDPHNVGVAVNHLHLANNFLQIFLFDKVNLVQENFVRKRDLLDCFVFGAIGLFFSKVLQKVLGIGNGEDRIEFVVLGNARFDEEGLAHWRGIGKTGGLDNDGVNRAVSVVVQLLKTLDKVSSNCAANASVLNLDHDFAAVLSGNQNFLIHSSLTEFVFNDRDFHSMIRL